MIVEAFELTVRHPRLCFNADRPGCCTQRAGCSRGDRVGRLLLHCRETV